MSLANTLQVFKMLSIESSFFLMLSVCCGVALWAGKRYGREYSVGIGMAISLLAGSWFQFSIGGLPINVATASTIALMAAVCFHSFNRIWTPLTVLDLVLISMACWHVCVDTYYGVSLPWSAAMSYAEWGLPYVAGRFAIVHKHSIANLSPWFSVVAIAIASGAMLESLTSLNIWETLFVPVDDLVLRVTGKRYNLLYRAIGPLRHPIFLSVLMMTLIPWCVALIDTSQGDRHRKWLGVIGIIACIAGMLATVSRGPLLALFLAAAFGLATCNRYIRWIVISLAIFCCVFLFKHWDATLDVLKMNINENRSRIVQIDGQSEVYDASRNRLYVVQIYGPIFLKGGLMGYGTESTNEFPPDIPGLSVNTKKHPNLAFVDNSYILVGLRFGWMGCGLLVALFLTAIGTSFSLRRTAATYLHPMSVVTPTVLAVVALGLAIEVATVFWAYDYAFWVLLYFGVISGLASQSKLAARG